MSDKKAKLTNLKEAQKRIDQLEYEATDHNNQLGLFRRAGEDDMKAAQRQIGNLEGRNQELLGQIAAYKIDRKRDYETTLQINKNLTDAYKEMQITSREAGFKLGKELVEELEKAVVSRLENNKVAEDYSYLDKNKEPKPWWNGPLEAVFSVLVLASIALIGVSCTYIFKSGSVFELYKPTSIELLSWFSGWFFTITFVLCSVHLLRYLKHWAEDDEKVSK